MMSKILTIVILPNISECYLFTPALQSLIPGVTL